MAFFFKRKQRAESLELIARSEAIRQRSAEADFAWNDLTYTGIASIPYNGETQFGQLGPIYEYKAQFNELRARSWQAYYESDFAQIVINRTLTWVIGNGLKLQCEPSMPILEAAGVAMEKETKRKFVRNVEAQYDLMRESTDIDHSGQLNYNQLSWEKEKNALIGGDVLVINRVVKGQMTQQIIDGAHVQSPLYGTEEWPQSLADGNRIIDGVEVDHKNRHVAYYVRTYILEGDMPTTWKFTRVEAYGKKTGTRLAYLYYGCKYRINSVRGMPLLAACLQKAKEIDDYSTATLTQARNAASVSYQNVVEKDATESKGWAKETVQGFDVGFNSLPRTNDGKQVGKTFKVDTVGHVISNAPGNKIETIENKNPLYFRDFYEVRRDSLFAVAGVPPNVAMGLYNDSYSASRASQQDWKHTLNVKRENHRAGTLAYDYRLWFELQVINGDISAPGFIGGSIAVKKAYLKARFTGATVAAIDPVAEAKAARIILGAAAAAIPLNDAQDLTEKMDGGDLEENMEQMKDALEKCEVYGIEIPMTGGAAPENTKEND